jgi:S-formylglutathione hydrolase FrmB
MILDGRIKPVILVSADAFGPGGPGDRTDYLNNPRRCIFVEDYFADELPRFIDAKFRTIPNAESRALTGLSSGGYGAVNIGGKHPDRFRILCSHSGFFRPQTDEGYVRGMLGPPGPAWDANDPLKAARDGRIDRRLHIYLDIGRSDDLLVQSREFARALARDGVDHEFSVVDGGHHWNLWRRQLKYSLEFVDSRSREFGDAEPGKKPTGPVRNRR